MKWAKGKIGDHCEITSSKRIFLSEYVEAGVPFYRSKEIIESSQGQDISEPLYISQTKYNDIKKKFGVPVSGDMLLTSVGTIGIPYVVKPEDYFYFKDGNLTWFKDIDKKRVLPEYLMCWLTSNFGKQKLDEITIGSTQAALTISGLKTISIELPTIEYQRRIASILTSLDDKIDLLRRENATLEAMAETLFRQWFVVEAKEEWEEGKLGDYVDETIGGEWGKENPEGDFIKPVQCIRGTDIADLNVGLATKTPIRYVKESKFEKIEPRNGDIIMEISGGTENQSTGRVAYINDDVKTLFDYPIIFSNFCRLLRVKEEHTYFIYCYLKYLYDQDEFFNLENGSSGIKNLDYKALLYELTYPIPNDRQQILDFNDKVGVYFEKINRNKQQIQTLIQTRDGLLPRLMGGEICSVGCK